MDSNRGVPIAKRMSVIDNRDVSDKNLLCSRDDSS